MRMTRAAIASTCLAIFLCPPSKALAQRGMEGGGFGDGMMSPRFTPDAPPGLTGHGFGRTRPTTGVGSHVPSWQEVTPRILDVSPRIGGQGAGSGPFGGIPGPPSSPLGGLAAPKRVPRPDGKVANGDNVSDAFKDKGIPYNDFAAFKNTCFVHAEKYRTLVTDDLNLDSLKSPETVDNMGRNCMAKAINDARLAPMRQFIGALYNRSSGYYYCTATLISPKFLITARHCLFESPQPGSAPSAGPVERLKAGDLFFFRTSEPKRAYHVDALLDSAEGLALGDTLPLSRQTSDYALIRLKDEVKVPGAFPTIASVPPKSGTKLSIPGFFFPEAYSGSTPLPHKPGTVPVTGAWADFIKFDKFGQCAVYAVKNGACLLHACSTDGGMSGSPVLDMSSPDKPVVLGVHSSFLESGSECWHEQNRAIPNVGIIVTPKKIHSACASGTASSQPGQCPFNDAIN